MDRRERQRHVQTLALGADWGQQSYRSSERQQKAASSLGGGERCHTGGGARELWKSVRVPKDRPPHASHRVGEAGIGIARPGVDLWGLSRPIHRSGRVLPFWRRSTRNSISTASP